MFVIKRTEDDMVFSKKTMTLKMLHCLNDILLNANVALTLPEATSIFRAPQRKLPQTWPKRG